MVTAPLGHLQPPAGRGGGIALVKGALRVPVVEMPWERRSEGHRWGMEPSPAAAPLRQMSSGSVPGSSGENLIYYLFAGVACTAGGYYAYRTITSDKKRYNERIHAIQQSNTAEWKPKPWPPQQVVGEGLDVAAASAHEDNVDSIQEGTASAAQEMPDTSSRNQEAVEDESGQNAEASSATTGSQEIPKDS